MPYTIISPSMFKTVPWKNGKGSTVEIAINDGATLDKFDWRLSMADVTENGQFSDFSGYQRNLILIKGNGLTLTHNEQRVDNLDQHLAFATFDGASKTVSTLLDGPITDFNLITASGAYSADVATYAEQSSIEKNVSDIHFIYGLSDSLKVSIGSESEQLELQPRHLMQVTGAKGEKLTVSGSDFIVIGLTGNG
ncbi:HutD/Ves family protein [Thalassotalea mangrovi]|uniref:HutD family protein n=1 Tax=Thalassotalea mangrovi TaxID=2572245 RepID=A0A4U1B2J5_9GAMM|nr:HutD family protein [Thalassotalea mangrovi]TKB43808.1 HutD family protein [Thalassotalea mangrovi]